MPDPAEFELTREVEAILERWVDATVNRDADAYSGLFLRDTDPVVVWPSGEITRGWKTLHDHVVREFYHAKAMVQSVDVHDVQAVRVTDETAEIAFQYDVHAKDLWGTSLTVRRLATMSLAWTKDGLRIASAHFGNAPPASVS